MAAPPPDAGLAVSWLRAKLAEERRSIELLHESIAQELKLKLDSNGPWQAAADDRRPLAPAFAPPTLQLDAGPGDLRGSPAPPADNGSVLRDASKGVPEVRPPGPPGSDAGQVVVTEENGCKKEDDLDHWNKHKHNDSTFAKITENAGNSDSAQNCVQKIVLGKTFEWFFGVIIIVHILIMTLESQYVGLGVGHNIGYPGYDEPKKEVWPNIHIVFRILDITFGAMYTIELSMKVIALNRHFVEAWNLLDLLIVFMWYLDNLAGSVKLPVDTMLLRLLRLAKLLRLIKVFKTMRGFEQLFLMLTALKGSAHILVWVSVLLFTSLLGFALLLNQLMVSYFVESDSEPLEKKREAFRYFGTFSRSLFSMFELTLGNWIPISRFLLEDVTEFGMIFSIGFKLTMGFAVIAVINGCFIKETFKLAEQDDTLMILQKDKERHVHFEKMMKLLDVADTTGSGTLTRQEFVDVCQDPEVDIWLGAQGLRVTDAGAIFDLIDTGTGYISKGELVMGARKLQGNARSLDVAKNQVHLVRMVQSLVAHIENLGRYTAQAAAYSPQPAPADNAAPLADFHAAHAQRHTELMSKISGLEQGPTDMRDGIGRLRDEIAEIMKLLSARSVCTPSPVLSPPAALASQEGSRSKVICGCPGS